VALETLNLEQGLGFDEFDLDYYTNIFKQVLKRNPTDVECFDLGQSNSEHSRHWFFGGKLVIDGIEKGKTLFQLVKDTLPSNSNSVIAFHDNSSVIRGYLCRTLQPERVDAASSVKLNETTLHPLLTAETHNFPTGVAPFPGAETGTGGRLRDVMATGRGAYTVAGVAGYCVGNLRIPGYVLPWENEDFVNPTNLASPLEIIVEASNGASDYGNKYGEPVICGFTRSFGQRLPNGERYEWIKPIMFSAGVGALDDLFIKKEEAVPNMLVAKLGGPAYRIGIGGGAASSRVSSEEETQLDFDAVQRGDAEMGNRLGRFVRACADLGVKNPIVSIHDQGAGGNGNVLKEIVEPAGAHYDIRNVLVGDETMSVLELWGAEYQENNAILIHKKDLELCERISKRENCPLQIVGHVTGSGSVVVIDSTDNDGTGPPAVDLPLELVLGKMPQKEFRDFHLDLKLKPNSKFDNFSSSLKHVLRLLSVGSKRFLVHKVDRSVTGLVAQQQCVGPLQLPLSNVAVTAHSHFSTTGTAISIGEQPLKGLVSPSAMARMAVAEAMTNLVFCVISSLKHVKASCNWMYAAKLPGEGARMYDACEALSEALKDVGFSIDGGKDSLSMAAKCGPEIVKCPGEMSLTTYVTCPDITKIVTPDLKAFELQEVTILMFVDLSQGHARLGGSALGQVHQEIGKDSPDISDFLPLTQAFAVIQNLIQKDLILAGHDRSDGGIIVTLLEMAFSGNCSIEINVEESQRRQHDMFQFFFNEEAGFVLEILQKHVDTVNQSFEEVNVACSVIGKSSPFIKDSIIINFNQQLILKTKMTSLRDTWEETSFELEKLQRNPELVLKEQENLKYRTIPKWKLTFKPQDHCLLPKKKHKVLIMRQEGSNGDKEMQSAFYKVGFDVWDVTTSDLLHGKFSLGQDDIRGIVFVGGFSYGDVLDSAKGWAAGIRFSKKLNQQFLSFRNRPNTFSLGVCNGCQLMALLGWIPFSSSLTDKQQPRLLQNASHKYESRFVSTIIQPSPSIFFREMQGSSLGVWIAHGEGRFYFPSEEVFQTTLSKNLAPLRYVNDLNEITTEYPFNPNGSPEGIAAICSEDGRHLAMMPHPERTFLKWQWPWMPIQWKETLQASPWLKMFQNVMTFCEES